MTDREKVLKRLKTALLISLAVFIVSFIALAIRIVYVSFFAEQATTVVLPDNIVEGQAGFLTPICNPAENLLPRPAEAQTPLLSTPSPEAAVLELYRGQPADNDAFHAQNMFPGDTVTKYYCLKVYHGAALPVYFHVTDIQDTKSLGDILNIRVTQLDSEAPQVLCDKSFSEIEGEAFPSVFLASPAGETIVYYRIDISLPTAAGNEYQGASLTATFRWCAEAPAPNDPIPTPPTHDCETPCPTCGKCLDKSCTAPSCAEKCLCSPLMPKPAKRYPIWPWTILPALSLTSTTVLAIIFYKQTKEVDGHD